VGWTPFCLLSRQVSSPLHRWCYTTVVQGSEYGPEVWWE